MSNSFKKMAFKIESPEQSAELQRILFEQGYQWWNGKEVSLAYASYLYTSTIDNGIITWDTLHTIRSDQPLMDTQQYIDDYKRSKIKIGFETKPKLKILETSQLESSDGSHADYYQLPEGAKELQDIISYLNLNAQLGEIIRAVYRSGKVGHSSRLRDAKKIKFYAEAEIKRLEMYGED